MKFKTLILSCLLVFFLSMPAYGVGVSVSYTLSGSSENWTLDFSATNDLGIPYLDLYYLMADVSAFFAFPPPPGVLSMTAPTTNWIPDYPSSYPYPYNYQITWQVLGTPIPDMIQTGETLGGFKVTLNSISAPTAIPWKVYLYDWDYFNSDPKPDRDRAYYQDGTININPVFSGVATASVNLVPEPATMLLLGLGLVGLAGVRRMQK